MPVLKILMLFWIISVTSCGFGSKKNVNNILEPTGKGMLVIEPIVYATDTLVNAAVRKECQLPKKLTVLIDKNAAAQYAQILNNTDLTTVPSDTYILNIVINRVITGEDNFWGGDSGITLQGVLKQNGAVLGDFRAGRLETKGMFDGFKDSCLLLSHSIKALSIDIAGWLENPVRGAVLGNFQSGLR